MILSGGENYRLEAVRRKLRIQETQQEMLLNCSYVRTALRLIIIWVSLSHNATKLLYLNTYRVALDRLCLHTGLDSMWTVQLLDKISFSSAFCNRECKTSFQVPNAPLPYLLAHKSQNHSLYYIGNCHKLISQNIKPHQDGGQLY